MAAARLDQRSSQPHYSRCVPRRTTLLPALAALVVPRPARRRRSPPRRAAARRGRRPRRGRRRRTALADDRHAHAVLDPPERQGAGQRLGHQQLRRDVDGRQRARLHRRRPDHHQQRPGLREHPRGRGVGRRPDHRAGHLRHDPGARARRLGVLHRPRSPSSLLGADEPGVYWFGVHALGTSAAGRDVVADGRARTFLPYVPAEGRGAPIATALVLPVRHQVLNDPDGTLSDEDGWLDTLGEGGQLASILDFGLRRRRTSADLAGRPRGARRRRPPRRTATPPRELVGARRGRHRRGRRSGAAPVRRRPAGRRPPGARAVPEEQADIAEAWLVKLNQAVTGKQVLALPWGDVDVAAAAKRDTDVYTDARARSGTVLNVSQAAMTPAMSARAASSTTPRSPSPTTRPRCWSPTGRWRAARRPAWRRTPSAR